VLKARHTQCTTQDDEERVFIEKNSFVYALIKPTHWIRQNETVIFLRSHHQHPRKNSVLNKPGLFQDRTSRCLAQVFDSLRRSKTESSFHLNSLVTAGFLLSACARNAYWKRSFPNSRRFSYNSRVSRNSFLEKTCKFPSRPDLFMGKPTSKNSPISCVSRITGSWTGLVLSSRSTLCAKAVRHAPMAANIYW